MGTSPEMMMRRGVSPAVGALSGTCQLTILLNGEEMSKTYTLCLLNGNISEWLDEADTRVEAEEKFERLKEKVRTPGDVLIIGEAATGRWMKKWPESWKPVP